MVRGKDTTHKKLKSARTPVPRARISTKTGLPRTILRAGLDFAVPGAKALPDNYPRKNKNLNPQTTICRHPKDLDCSLCRKTSGLCRLGVPRPALRTSTLQPPATRSTQDCARAFLRAGLVREEGSRVSPECCRADVAFCSILQHFTSILYHFAAFH